jgi:hypothetical protein
MPQRELFPCKEKEEEEEIEPDEIHISTARRDYLALSRSHCFRSLSWETFENSL